jgi:biopolymer transport protein ExbD
MIDVVFQLIIFFLVSSHLARQEAQLPLPLPMAGSGQDAGSDHLPRVIVNVLADGSVLMAGRRVTADELRQRLQTRLRESSDDLEVRIRSDRDVPYLFVRPILLAAARAGVWNVTFSVVRREQPR